MPENERSIAILLRDLSGGGAERSMINIANGLAAMGVKVDFVLFSLEGSFESYVSEDVNIVNLDVKPVGLGTFTAIWPLIKYFKKSTPRYVLTTLEATTIVTSYALKLVSKPPKLLIRVATTFGNEKRPWIREILIKRLYQSHGGFFAVNSLGSRDDLVKTLGIEREKIKVIYNAVDIALIKRMSDKGLEDSDIDAAYIVNIGRLTVAKRQDVLIKAFAKLDSRDDLKLLILGEGPLRENLESLVDSLDLKSKVVMPGFVKNPYAFLSKASAFVLSSDYEGMPTVLLEALATGCPVVSTDCPAGPNEILEGGKWGELVKTGDAKELADAISKTLQNQINRNELKSRAAEFSIDKLASEYHQLIFGG